MKFYVDTCVYLNLWKREESILPFWKLAKDFFEKHNDATFYYSGFVLKELKFILSEDVFERKRKLFIHSPNFQRMFLSDKEYGEAQRLDKQLGVGFFDIIHLLLAKKSNSVLVTRDNELLRASKKFFVKAGKPEEL